jgi:hypothetical protein
MTFVRTKKGDYLNLQVVREAKIGPDHVTLLLDNGASHGVSREEWFAALGRDQWTAIPALPGTYLINAWRQGDSIAVLREPIVGWSVSANEGVEAVTASGIREIDHKFAVLHADGKVQDLLGYHEDYDQWFNEMLETHFEAEFWDRKAGKRKLH